MAVYQVKNGLFHKSLVQTIQSAYNGDTIILDTNYQEHIGCIVIDKDLTIIGTTVNIPGENKNQITNSIYGRIVVSNNALLTLRGIEITHECFEYKETNAINAKNATINIDNCILITREKVDKYPMIYAEKAVVNIDNSTIISNFEAYSECFFLDSNLNINNSIIDNICIHLKNANSNINNVEMNNKYNCIFALNSNINTQYTILNRDTIEQNDSSYPTVFLKSSKLDSKNSKFIQKNKSYSGIYLHEQSKLISNQDEIEKLQAEDSKIFLYGTTVDRQLYLYNGYAYIEDCRIKEKYENYYYLVAEKFSTIYGTKLTLEDFDDERVNICKYSLLAVKELNVPNTNAQYYVCDDTSYINKIAVNRLGTQRENINKQTETSNTSDAYETLMNMIGLQKIKDEVDNLKKMISFNKKRQEEGKKVQELSLHSLFTGNPGTGKTMVARLIGQIVHDTGIFNSNELKFIEVDESDLVSNYVGETAIKTKKVLESALGGVLFIDEAYTLNKKDASVNHGKEAIDTILKFMEDHRSELMIIFAGYAKEMGEFLRVNSGLQSRITNTFVFDDYTPEEITEIGLLHLKKSEYTLEDEAYYKEKVKKAYQLSIDHSNGRWMRNFNEGLIKVFIRNSENNVSVITNQVIDEFMNIENKYRNQEDNSYEKLQQLIGINNVKKQVDSFINKIEYNARREKEGLQSEEMTLHSLFLGNPGTGKTTVARLLGNILYNKGITKKNVFIEASRSELVAGYLGQTAMKTKEVLISALGGILFIDEAYTLYQNSEDRFGKEAIDTILKFMEDYRQNIIIIFAGYTKEMSYFLESNSGLKSRIPFIFNFEDYNINELVQIGLKDLNNRQYKVSEKLYYKYLKDAYETSYDNSNARFVRNFNDKLILNLSTRFSSQPEGDLSLIIEEDFPNNSLMILGKCPHCGDDIILKESNDHQFYYFHRKNNECNFRLYPTMKRYKDNKDEIILGPDEVKALLRGDSIIATLESKEGKLFKAYIALDVTKDGYVRFKIIDFA